MGRDALWPFGKTVVKRADAGVASGIGNILWYFKLIPVSLLPMGREIVSVEQARALGVEPMFGRGDGLRG